jgi:hypothetical protein
MYSVTYNYYNYGAQSKHFPTYAAAKSFLTRIARSAGVRRAELIIMDSV